MDGQPLEVHVSIALCPAGIDVGETTKDATGPDGYWLLIVICASGDVLAEECALSVTVTVKS